MRYNKVQYWQPYREPDRIYKYNPKNPRPYQLC